MKHLIRTFALGLITSSAIIGIFYTLQEDHSSAAETDINLEEMIAMIENRGFEVVEKGTGEKNDKAGHIAKPVPPEPEESGKPEEVQKTYVISIEKGMTSQDISKDLFEAGMIKDSSMLNDYLQDNNLSREVQIGKFEITNKMEIEEIANAITSK
ncbi:endolytic transglycosylase MltG [Thalassobacillus pellis]|uniref:endolytic transglycosylase MltG n=1 Tax=Thalassobacillus pellis TaxID=748008 RepID=UPI00195FB911|nr:endolytic transglycosylase MltG [Thalassobacillus pellis]MBM7552278.1 hypothetical protein [Thalassobacillus pellis]